MCLIYYKYSGLYKILSQNFNIFGTMVEIDDIKQKVEIGGIFFISDFAQPTNYEAVRKALQRLVNKGEIERISKGVYFLPKRNSVLGNIYPQSEQIAKAIAKRDKARIIPTGSTALHELGLSSQVPMKHMFLTDGSTRNIKVGNQSIQFKKTSPKNLSIKHRLSNLIIQALKSIGEENVTKEQLKKIQAIINKSGELELVLKNIKFAPIWIQKILIQE